MHRIKITMLAVLLLLLHAGSALAAREYSTESGLLMQQIGIDENDYRAGSLMAKLGYRLSEDSAVELLIGAGVTGKTIENTTVTPANVTGLFYRIGSIHQRRFRTFLLAGASVVTIDIEQSGGESRSEYGSLSWGVGAEERFRMVNDASLSLTYLSLYNQDNVSIRGLSLGFRIDFE